MAKSYFKHPLLTNPAKWLTTPRSHSHKLYNDTFYDIEAIKKNPYALSLRGTGYEKNKDEFPLGSMIRLIVREQDSQLKKYDKVKLVPSVGPVSEQMAFDKKNDIKYTNESGTIFGLPALSHVINSKSYVSYVSKVGIWRSILPEEFRYKNEVRVLTQVDISPTMVEDINTLLIETVQKLLKECKGEGDKGFWLVKDDSIGITFSDTQKVSLGDLIEYPEQETFILFESDSDLAYAIVKLVDYNAN